MAFFEMFLLGFFKLPFFQNMLKFTHGTGESIADRTAGTSRVNAGVSVTLPPPELSYLATREMVGLCVIFLINNGTFYLEIKEQKPGKTVNYSLSFTSRVNEF